MNLQVGFFGNTMRNLNNVIAQGVSEIEVRTITPIYGNVGKMLINEWMKLGE